MKVISSLIIINKDEATVVYECDNKKNIKCKGHNNCRECQYTTDLKYAKNIKQERTRIELKEELEEMKKEIKIYKETIRRMINGENIFNFRTVNEIRKIYDLEQKK